MKDTRYETRPLESWIKMKELRRWHFRHTWEAQSKGEVLVLGMAEAFTGYLAGMGDYGCPSYGPYFTRLVRNPEELVKCLEVVEAKGHTRDLCSCMRCYLGQMYQGLSTRGPTGVTVRHDFIFQVTNCHTMAQTGQLFSEYLDIPYLSIDIPYSTEDDIDREYILAQLQDGIEFMEKAAGREYDDEKLIEATKTEWRIMQHWAKIQDLVRSVPAPLDLRHLWSLRMPLLSMRHKKEVLEYLKALYDEVQDRVRNQISARGIERMRFLHEGFPPYYFISILKQPMDYGTIYVTCANNLAHGLWERRPDGHWVVDETPVPELRTREDALRAQIYMYCGVNHGSTWFPGLRPEEAVKRAQDWHCEAAVIALDRGCHGYGLSMLETKQTLQQAGISVGTYEHSQTDPREFSASQAIDQLEAFMENLGLSKLDGHDEGKEEEGGD
jgi:benzoyl-CoA reductase subunit B